MLYVLVLLVLWRAPLGAEVCDPSSGVPGARTSDSIDSRYDDFFRHRRADEERERNRNQARTDLRDHEAERNRNLELARREYVRTRRPKVDSTAGDRQWEAVLKARTAQNEAARRCYVTRRNQLEQVVRRGRQIPANAEFGLDE